MFFRLAFCTDLPPWQCGTMRGGQEYAGGSTEAAFNYFVCSSFSIFFFFVISFSNIYVIRLFDSQCMFWIGLFWQPVETIKTDWPTIMWGKKRCSIFLHVFFFSYFTGHMFATNKDSGEEAKNFRKIKILKVCEKVWQIAHVYFW